MGSDVPILQMRKPRFMEVNMLKSHSLVEFGLKSNYLASKPELLGSLAKGEERGGDRGDDDCRRTDAEDRGCAGG